MRKLSLALVLLLSSPVLLAQDLLSCLHPDVLQGLARSGITGVGDGVVTRTLPPEMDGVDPPPAFELIATSVRAAETTVAYVPAHQQSSHVRNPHPAGAIHTRESR